MQPSADRDATTDAPTTPPRAINIGIIGFGRIGSEHAGHLASAANCRVVAVADQTPARRELAGAAGRAVHADIDPLLQDPAIEAVLVSTPTSQHFEHARRALEANKHVMIEKPMAMNLGEARWLQQAAVRQKRMLSVFHNRRWDADFLAVKNAVESQVFGRVINVESRLGQWASCVGPAAREWRPNWRNEAAWGGGGLFDWGSHFLDQLWRLFWPDKPVRVFAQLRGNIWSSDCDDFARVVIDFESGAAGMVEVNTTTARPLPRWHIDGAAGSADSPFSLRFDVNAWAQLEFTPASDNGAQIDASRPLRKVQVHALSEVDIWMRFAAACRGEGLPAVSAESVLPTMALLDAARESSRSGVAVAVRDLVQWVY